MRAENRPLRFAAAALLVLAAAGCRQNMHDQNKVKPLAPNAFFADGQGARPLPANTVARGFLREDQAFYTGLGADGRAVAAFPMPVTMEVLRRGQERYNVFCSPCHDSAGTGRGMIVQRGYTQPSSYHIDRLRQAPAGYFYDVMTRGFGVMPSYASQVPPEDRWAIAAYVRALQLSQNAQVSALTPGERARLEEAWRRPRDIDRSDLSSRRGMQVSPESSSGGGATQQPPVDDHIESGRRPGGNVPQQGPVPTRPGEPANPPGGNPPSSNPSGRPRR